MADDPTPSVSGSFTVRFQDPKLLREWLEGEETVEARIRASAYLEMASDGIDLGATYTIEAPCPLTGERLQFCGVSPEPLDDHRVKFDLSKAELIIRPAAPHA